MCGLAFKHLKQRNVHGFSILPCLVAIFVAIACAYPRLALAEDYTPESPMVKQMVAKGVDYIKSTPAHPNFGVASLRALALIKGNCPLDHPHIQHAVKLCRESVSKLNGGLKEKAVYEVSVATIFLCELDAEEFKPEITAFMETLMSWQKKEGGWGYLEGSNKDTGDISQTQYVVLAMWTADRTGVFKLKVDAAERVANYLMRVQDPTGGWGYQGVDPGSFTRVDQVGMQHSLSAAGAGTVYICADLLRLSRGSQMTRRRQANVPTSLRVVTSGNTQAPLGPLTNKVDRSRLDNCLSDGTRWLGGSNYTISPQDWPSYYMYAFERFQSFRELAENIDEESPKWYNDGVEFLRENQEENGRWSFDIDYDTSLAILFLTRGTKKSIQKAEGYGGRLRGGRGLPSDTTNVMIGEDGTVIKSPFKGQAENLLAMLEAQSLEDFDATEQEFEIALSSDALEREEQLQRLRRLLAAEEFNIRYTAVKVLAGTNDLDNVPALIFALDDPDRRVVVRARDALRGLSRKFEGFGLSDNPTDAEKVTAVQRWKEWYRLIRPSARFLK
ncbi:MAG: hypothetical protein KDB27_03655 [Planctomycetales bacterium]|nr:hypothetical protein [Planctomycetales bacterium]